MKIILRIILLSIFLYSCSNHKKDLDIFKYDTEVIAVFTPRGIGDQSSAGLLYSGMIAATDSTKLLVFDGDFTHPDIYTAHVPFYGMMYKAGYVASKMIQMLILILFAE